MTEEKSGAEYAPRTKMIRVDGKWTVVYLTDKDYELAQRYIKNTEDAWFILKGESLIDEPMIDDGVAMAREIKKIIDRFNEHD